MSNLFNENDEYDDAENYPKLHFAKVQENGRKKIKLKTQKTTENDVNDSVGGRFVLLRKEEPTSNETVPSHKDRKRQINENTGTTEPKKQKLPSVPKSKPTNAPQLKDKLIDQLKGSRFRYLNEVMYSSKGSESAQLFKEDPSAFSAYHVGYRQQIAKWPMNPLQRIIKSFKKLPKNCVVADFGCGDALLAKSIPQQVYSLDLVAATEGVIECDMAKTPLETASIDVAVYCLSLMGTNLIDFFAEANRVLKTNGHIKIAEVSSRFQNVNHFIRDVQNCGFALVSKDLDDKLFYFFNFKKVKSFDRDNKKLKEFSLAPCLYKKR